MRVLACFIVLLPLLAVSQADTITDKINKDSRFTILRKLLKTTGMDTILASSKYYTLFAPTDAAFKKLPPDVLKAVVENDRIGSQVVMAHVLANKYGIVSFMNGTSAPGQPLTHRLKTFTESYLTTVCEKRGLTANDSLVTGELYTGNGAILIVDTVMPLIIDRPLSEGLSRSAPHEMFEWGLAKYIPACIPLPLPPGW